MGLGRQKCNLSYYTATNSNRPGARWARVSVRASKRFRTVDCSYGKVEVRRADSLTRLNQLFIHMVTDSVK